MSARVIGYFELSEEVPVGDDVCWLLLVMTWRCRTMARQR